MALKQLASAVMFGKGVDQLAGMGSVARLEYAVGGLLGLAARCAIAASCPAVAPWPERNC